MSARRRSTVARAAPSGAQSPLKDEDRQRERAQALLAQLRTHPTAGAVKSASEHLTTLRNLRAFDLMGLLAEAICRIEPADTRARRLYAQALIEAGATTAAIDMLRQLIAAIPRQHHEAPEAWGLLGRAFKQIFLDAPDPGSAAARAALVKSTEAYLEPYRDDPRRNTWHGVNLLALVSRARQEGWQEVAPKVEPAALATQLIKTLRAVPQDERDEWYLPTLAEATLGMGLTSGDLTAVEDVLRHYLCDPNLKAFQVASTLRQFTEVWGLDRLRARAGANSPAAAATTRRARGLVDILRIRLLQLPGGVVALSADEVATSGASVAGSTQRVSRSRVSSSRGSPSPQAAAAVDVDRSQLEAILGEMGPKTFSWWRAGIEAARSVAVVRQKLGRRLGSGFLLRAGDLGLKSAPDELLLLTNFHVVNPNGATPGIRPEDAEVVFEADDAGKAYAVQAVVWASTVDQHDAALLRLQALPAGIPPLPISTALPPVPPAEEKKRPRVYIIGYPGGRELSFSFQDNELLDHEGPPGGNPQIPGVCRVHYHAPTEGGNSGSPVFDDGAWKVIALHHKGGKFGMPRLNGAAGTYAANEGLAMATLAAAVSTTSS